MNKMLAVVVMVAVTGCKTKDKEPAAAPAPAPTAKAIEPLPTAAPVAATAPTLLTAGAAKLGCVAWSDSLHTAACITGDAGEHDSTFALVAVGQPPLAKLTDKLDDATVLANNELLAKQNFAAITATATPIALGKPTDAGGNVALTLTSKTKVDPHAEPDLGSPIVTKLTATCGTTKATLLEVKEYGTDFTATVRTIGAHALVELTGHSNHEGEERAYLDAIVLDPATCKFVTTVATK